MKALYLDCVSGIAGDMTLAALLDAGASLAYIEGHLRMLPLDPFVIRADTVDKRGITAKILRLHIGEPTHEHSHSHDEALSHGHHSHSSEDEHAHTHSHEHSHNHDHDHDHDHNHDHSHAHSHDHDHNHAHSHDHDHNHAHSHDHDHSHAHSHDHDHHTQPEAGHAHEHRKASTIIRMIEDSRLPERVKRRSIAVFQAIAAAEGKIHGVSPEEVHFHEVGAMDSIIDTIGVCLAMEELGIEEIYASPVPTGHGKIKIAHGLYPIPAPATAELLTGIPLAPLDVKGELTTPTGAGILKALVKEFGSLPAGIIRKIGYGAGNKDFAHPNVVRALLIDIKDAANGSEEIFVVEAQLDDMTGEALGFTMERLFDAGALDVFYTPVYMKKNRPGTLVTVLTLERNLLRCEEVILLETTTLGVRRSKWTRQVLDRSFITAATPYGPIRIKQAVKGGQILHYSPEYEDVAEAARRSGVPFQTVYQQAMTAGSEHAVRADK